jgi:hypothetical protein
MGTWPRCATAGSYAVPVRKFSLRERVELNFPRFSTSCAALRCRRQERAHLVADSQDWDAPTLGIPATGKRRKVVENLLLFTATRCGSAV